MTYHERLKALISEVRKEADSETDRLRAVRLYALADRLVQADNHAFDCLL